MSDTERKCHQCGKGVGRLEGFPAATGAVGVRCLDCYASSAEGRRMPTAEEVVRLWGGPVRGKGKGR